MNPGTPMFDVDVETIDNYRLNRHPWTAIATMVGTTPKTLREWRGRVNYQEPSHEFDDNTVDDIIRTFVEGQPMIGETIIIAHVNGVHNIRGTRQQFRDSIARVDPEGLAERRALFGQRLIRRKYDIVGPHLLWHLDGWHKLIRYMMVVHGCIDGGTRAIIYITINNNNRSTCHLTSFEQAVIDFGTVPSRVRMDYGGENVLVADYMIEHRGEGRGSALCGSSKFNTRIERLWRDLRKDVSNVFLFLLFLVANI